MNRILIRVFAVLVMALLTTAIQAQDSSPTISQEDAVEPQVVYYGMETTFDAIEASKVDAGAGALYCAQILTVVL